MSLFIQNFLLCVLTLLFVQNVLGVRVNVKKSLELGVRVNVTNSLEDNLDLTIHCKAQGQDLGVHLLHHGDHFSWYFTPSYINLYYCLFQWNDVSHYYDVFLARRDRSKLCNWYITKSGPCKVLPSGSRECHSWD
ncbi:unnamed protein product [Trifolium pratense]|uniref:Uncharacterized protein n=1 Tax=Trifolium pratense TaxID=57577 RepID=A0ACB0JQT1_TRIPR|nr:unnamed protein product [Trifolium pratense]